MKKRILTPEEVGALLDWDSPSGARFGDEDLQGQENTKGAEKAFMEASTGKPPENLYREVLEILGEAIIVTDPRGCILFGNVLSCHLLGKPLASIRRTPFDRSIRLTDANGAYLDPSPVVIALHELRKVPFPPGSRLLLSRGKTLSVMGAATPLLSRSGAVEGVAVSFHQTVRRGELSDPLPSAASLRVR